jgi:hypothetical protein
MSSWWLLLISRLSRDSATTGLGTTDTSRRAAVAGQDHGSSGAFVDQFVEVVGLYSRPDRGPVSSYLRSSPPRPGTPAGHRHVELTPRHRNPTMAARSTPPHNDDPSERKARETGVGGVPGHCVPRCPAHSMSAAAGIRTDPSGSRSEDSSPRSTSAATQGTVRPSQRPPPAG